ncbi:MAG: DUF87 domain-containing protein [Candidatus Nanoarchaeia archaeon]
MLGIISGKTSTNEFVFHTTTSIPQKFQYLKIRHKEGYDVLAQIIELETQKDTTRASCLVLGYRNEQGVLKMLRTPPEPDTEVHEAEDAFVAKVLGLGQDKNGAYIGVLEGRDKIKVSLDLNKLITKHLVILAKSGSGKSYALSCILEEILERGIPLLIIDPHGEYSSLKYPNEQKENYERFGIKPKGYSKQIKEYSVDVQKNPESQQLKLSAQNLTASELLNLLPAKLSSTQIGLLYSALMDLGKEANFEQLMINLQLEEHPAKWTLITIIDYLKKLNIFSPQPTTPQELIQPGMCSIINLRGVPPELQEIIVYKVLSDLFTARKNLETPPFFLVLEEAHNFCLTGDVNVLTSQGDKPLSEVSNKDIVATFNFENNSLEYQPVIKTTSSRKEKVYQIITEFENVIRATKDHPFFTRKGFNYTSGLDHIAIPLDSIYSKKRDLVIARLMGHISGDGWMANSGCVGFSGIKEDLIKIKKDLEYLGFKSSQIHQSKNTSTINSLDYGELKVAGEGYSFTSSRKCFYFFKNLGLPVGRRVLQAYSLPNFILNGSKEVIAEFLAALMGSDGYKLRIKNKNPDVIRLSFSKLTSLEKNGCELAKQMVFLFRSLGIRSSFWTRSGNKRKDGLTTIKFIIDVANDNRNFFRFVSLVGYRYHGQKEKTNKKTLYYYRHKHILLGDMEALRKKVIQTRAETGWGKVRLARRFNLRPSLIKTWIYDFKSHSRTKKAGLGWNFPSFQKWCSKYTNDSFIFDPVFKILPLGEKTVYNFSVKNQNFIANGALVHNCPERSFGEVKSSSIIRQIAAEGRKFGVGLGLVSQRVAKLDKSVISQASTQIILKLTNPGDLKAVSNSVEGITLETEREIRNLSIGTALVVGVVDMPLFVEIRPRKTKHGGEAVNILETFAAEYGGNDSREVLNLIIPKDVAKKGKIVLFPSLLLTCKQKGLQFNILINLANAHLIKDLEKGTGEQLYGLEKLSDKEKKILDLVKNTGTEFTTAHLFSTSGMQFSEIHDLVNAILKKGYFEKIGSNYKLSKILTAYMNLSSFKCNEKNEFKKIDYTEIKESKVNKQDVQDLLKSFLEIQGVKDCYLVNYE